MADERGFLVGQSLREKLKSTIAKVDSIAPGGPVSRIPTVIESPVVARNPQVFRVATISSAWSLNTLGTVKLKNVASTPNTVSVLNQLVSLPAPRSTNTTRIVNIAKDGTQWYLVSFQMSATTAVFASSTQAVTFIGTAATSQMSVITSLVTSNVTCCLAGTEVSVLTDVSASLNTNNCVITVNRTTTRITTVGETQNATLITSLSSGTVTTFSSDGTQTAVIFGGTHTATFISLEI